MLYNVIGGDYMSNRGGSQTILVTAGREEQIVLLYKELKKIIRENVNVEFSVAIKKIAGISVGTWYNYISEGKQKGKVSKYTVDNLSKFFELPAAIFTGEQEFLSEHKSAIIHSLRQKFYAIEESEVGPLLTAEEREALKDIKSILFKVNNFKNINFFNKVIATLKNIINIVKKKKEIIEIGMKINSDDNEIEGSVKADHNKE